MSNEPYDKWNKHYQKCRICMKKIKKWEKYEIIDGWKEHRKCIEKMAGRKFDWKKTKIISQCTCHCINREK